MDSFRYKKLCNREGRERVNVGWFIVSIQRRPFLLTHAESVLDTSRYVIHQKEMVTNTRNFLRSFTSFKAKARKGEAVRIQDKEGEFLFTAAATRKSLLGAAKGRIVFHGDLTKPTLPDESWRPSL